MINGDLKIMNAVRVFFLVICALTVIFAPAVSFGAGLQDAFKSDGVLKDFADQSGYDSSQSEDSLIGVVGKVIKFFLSLLGVIFLVLVILGGYRYMMAQGNESKVTEALGTIRMATIGLLIIVAAYALSYYIFATMSEGVLKP